MTRDNKRSKQREQTIDTITELETEHGTGFEHWANRRIVWEIKNDQRSRSQL